MEVVFSIIIPTFNRGHLLQQTINSVLKQNYPRYELLVVDDGSTDNTKEVVEHIIKTNPEIKITYIYQTNSERAAARNKGLLNSRGDYVIFFDSDDTLYPIHLSTAYQYIIHNNTPEFLHLRYDIKDESNNVTGKGPVYKEHPNERLIEGNFLSCNGVIVRRDIALQNIFNEDRDISGMEDWELWLRLAVNYPLHYINTITSSIINHTERSVVGPDKNKLIKRVNTIMETVLSNNVVTEHYKNALSTFKCSCLSYLALHLSLLGYKKEAFSYLQKSISVMPSFIFKKRFFAIIKHLF